MAELGQKQSRIEKLRSIGIFSDGAGEGGGYYGSGISGGVAGGGSFGGAGGGAGYYGAGSSGGMAGSGGGANRIGNDGQTVGCLLEAVKKLDEKLKRNEDALAEEKKRNKQALDGAKSEVIKEAKADLEKTKEDVLKEAERNLAESTSSSRKEIFSVMALFFTIFAFVSFSIQIFSRVDDVFSAAIILMTLMSSTFSVVCFFLRVMYDDKKWLKNLVVMLPIISALLLLLLIGYGKKYEVKLHPVGGSFQFTEGVRTEIREIVLGEIWNEKFQKGVESIVDERMGK